MNKPILATGFVVFSLLLPLRAQAAQFSNLFVFGDSLSDTGNVFNVSNRLLPPDPPYSNGRFTNGPNWIDYLAQDLGLEVNPITGNVDPSKGIDFSFGGATTGKDNTLALTFPQLQGLPGLQGEMGEIGEIELFQGFLQQTQQSADPNALYIVWIGANDYLPTQGSFVPFSDPTVPIANIAKAVNSLAAVGAKNIMLVNLPDLGKTPLALGIDTQLPGTSAVLTALTQAHNAALNNLEQSLDPDINLISFDVNSLFNSAIDNPGQFGLNDVTNPCLISINPSISCSNPDEFLFWDSQHPTTKGHQLIADAALEAIKPVPEPASPFGILTFGVLSLVVLKCRGALRAPF